MVYNASEVFQMGIEIEKNGRDFYKSAIDAVSDEDAKKLFSDLSDWEDGHVKLFTILKKEFDDAGSNDDFSLDEQEQMYLKASADSHVFLVNKDMNALVNNCNDVIDILKIALQFEKDSVVLYTSMKSLVPDDLGKSKINKLIVEEVSHVAMLQQKIALFSKK